MFCTLQPYCLSLQKATETLRPKLDEIITQHKGQTVGLKYGDTIVPRAFSMRFIDALTTHGFLIRGLTWWYYCATEDTRPRYGYGGPRGVHVPGWFSELTPDFDELNLQELEGISMK